MGSGKATCMRCSFPMHAMHLDNEQDPPVLYFVCMRGCSYSEGRKQWPWRVRIRRGLARIIARVGRRILGW